MTANDLLITLRSHHRTMTGYLADVENGRPVDHYDVEALGLDIARYHYFYQQALRAELERVAEPMERAA